ncbi:hypothetical protein [Candidatus Cetobacterium colombiensis]|uniref:hypothetical protein n=1 Tax=Candidatus Cetobacterium colombiensis TaxID=3073100 RepID=UPI00387DC51A
MDIVVNGIESTSICTSLPSGRLQSLFYMDIVVNLMKLSKSSVVENAVTILVLYGYSS